MYTQDCAAPLHAEAIAGIRLFNAGEYWKAHEALEQAWIQEPGAVRDLYRGILQAAVVYLHVTRANYPGAMKVYGRSQKWLTRWPPMCRGVQVGKLRYDLDIVIAEVRRLGPDGLAQFDPALLRPIDYEEQHG